MGPLTRDFFFLSYSLVIFFGAPSLTRGRVCLVSVFVIEVYSSLSFLQNIYIFITQSLGVTIYLCVRVCVCARTLLCAGGGECDQFVI
jgi:hypothetical protein